MIDIAATTDMIWANMLAKGFNTTNIEQEFNYTYAELAEAYESYRKDKGDVGEELAGVMIFVMSLAKILGVTNLEAEITRKLETNAARIYKTVGTHNIRLTKGEDYE